jgi:hypothetical protein
LNKSFTRPVIFSVPLGSMRTLVPRAQEAVGGKHLGQKFGLPEVAGHRRRAPDQDLAAFRVDSAFHAVVGPANAADVLARAGDVAQRAVLGQPITFRNLQPQAAVPAQDIGRYRRSTADGHGALVQPQRRQDLLLHDAMDDRQLEQQVQLLLRHLVQHGLLELDPQPGHAEEDGRLRALHVLGEGLQAVGEVDAKTAAELAVLDQGALDHVCQRQVRQHACLGGQGDARQAGLHGKCQGAEGVHHALGHAGGARCVDDGAQLIGGPHR